jgi:hypothetical protein
MSMFTPKRTSETERDFQSLPSSPSDPSDVNEKATFEVPISPTRCKDKEDKEDKKENDVTNSAITPEDKDIFRLLISYAPTKSDNKVLTALSFIQQEFDKIIQKYLNDAEENPKVINTLKAAKITMQQIQTTAKNNAILAFNPESPTSQDHNEQKSNEQKNRWLSQCAYHHQAIGVIQACTQVVAIHTLKRNTNSDLKTLREQVGAQQIKETKIINTPICISKETQTEIARGKLLFMYNLINELITTYWEKKGGENTTKVAAQRATSIQRTKTLIAAITPNLIKNMDKNQAEEKYNELINFIQTQRDETQKNHAQGWGYFFFGTESLLVKKYETILEKNSETKRTEAFLEAISGF